MLMFTPRRGSSPIPGQPAAVPGAFVLTVGWAGHCPRLGCLSLGLGPDGASCRHRSYRPRREMAVPAAVMIAAGITRPQIGLCALLPDIARLPFLTDIELHDESRGLHRARRDPDRGNGDHRAVCQSISGHVLPNAPVSPAQTGQPRDRTTAGPDPL